MNFTIKYIFRKWIVIVCLIGILSCSNTDNKQFSEVVKVSMRDVGHKLLLTNQDSTSLVQPIIVLEDLKFQLSFQEQLFIQPDSLVSIIKSSFAKAGLPQNYLTEVLKCDENEVAYSYEMKQHIENGIIPCIGRDLPKACYIIQVRFLNAPTSAIKSMYLYFIAIGILLLLIYVFFKRNKTSQVNTNNEDFSSIGIFKFYPEQNILIKEAVEINLSKKECELLEIFIAKPNQIIKRDELTKKVWEDKGVIVGRSLDTYISKLRKKLKDDSSIKLTNIHGVGYKLEVDSKVQ